MKKVLFILCIVFAVRVAAQTKYPMNKVPDNWQLVEEKEVLVGDFYYNIYLDKSSNEYCASVTKYDGTNMDVVKIPEKISYNGKKYIVRGMSSMWRNKVKGYKILKLPKTIKFVSEHSVCMGNPLLETVDFGNKSELETIGRLAFGSCERLRMIDIPNTVDSLGFGAFEGCKLLLYVSLPRYIKHVGSFAFRDCSSLRQITWNGTEPKEGISEELAKSLWCNIEEQTFSGCSSLTSFRLPEHKKKPIINITIGQGAFMNCSSLQSVTGGDFITRVEEMAFFECKKLKVLKGYYQIGQEYDLFVENFIGERAFNGCESLEKIDIYSVDTIQAHAFQDCKSIKDVGLGANYIGEKAFYNCTSLRNVWGLDKLMVFDPFIFFDCNSLENVGELNENADFKSDLSVLPNYKKMYNIPKIMLSYKYYAKMYVKNRIEEWQKKKEYESSENYRKRVNELTRNQKVDQLLDSARYNYIKEKQPKTIKCKIESYDADQGVYKIRVVNINTYWGYIMNESEMSELHASDFVYIFANVPVSEAPAFKENFEKVKIEPTYCISKNYLGIATCRFTLNGKKYSSPTLYDDETANVQIDLPPLEIDLGGGKKNDMAQDKKSQTPIDNTLDVNIPSASVNNSSAFAVIVGNERYSQVSNVDYAENDAKVFAEYCRKTLGIPQKNVRTYGNATYAGFVQAIKDVKEIAKAYNGQISVIFYYAGHGVPNESTKDAYLLPVDADGRQMETCYSVGRLYKELGEMGAKNVVVFMDACFSGAQRGEGMLASARGVALKAKAEAPQGNMVVFTAATGDETAYPYKEKGHGMFTYFLLKKLQETKGDCTLGELGEYIQTNVSQQSVVINRKSQTPTIVPSEGMMDSWRGLKLR
ncbi:MAG: leucine-rich repeat protein [Prevotella sp.]|nr:leucine-rich repeat protein [Prevotella sp.]